MPGKFLPASARLLLEWVASLGHRALQLKTIKSYISAVCSLHVDKGLPFNACESETVHHVIRGIKHFYGEKACCPKIPILLSTLQQLATLSGDLRNHFNAAFDAAIKLAWSTFLCCGEFMLGTSKKFNPSVHLMRSSVTFLSSFETPAYICLNLPGSKTDPFCKGVSVLVSAALGSSTCPVSALKHLFCINPQPASSPLFSGPDDAPLSCSTFISTLKTCLLATSLNSLLYSGHSFRCGAASATASVGYADHEIQLLGRWHSDAYKLYINVSRDWVLGLSAHLHLAVLPA